MLRHKKEWCILNTNKRSRKREREGVHMKKVDNEYKSYIVEMLNKLDDSDESFLKQLCVLIRKHLERKRGR